MGKGQKPSWTFIFGIVIQLFSASVLATSEVAFGEDGYVDLYTSLLKECKKIKLPNGTMIQTVPKLLQTPFVTARSTLKSKYGPPLTQAVCRFPDCLNNPCQYGWCEETLQGYQCLCFPGFRGKHWADRWTLPTDGTNVSSSDSSQSATSPTSTSDLPITTGTKFSYKLGSTAPTDAMTITPSESTLPGTSATSTSGSALTTDCPIIHTPDAGNTKKVTYHGLNMTQGVTSFHFEVSANNDATLVLLQSFDEEVVAYILVIGKYNNGRGCLRRRTLESFKLQDYSEPCYAEPSNLVLSGIPTYDHYQFSIEGTRIKVRRYGSDVTLMDSSDPNPLSIKYVGIFTGRGSEGYWKFPTFC